MKEYPGQMVGEPPAGVFLECTRASSAGCYELGMLISLFIRTGVET